FQFIISQCRRSTPRIPPPPTLLCLPCVPPHSHPFRHGKRPSRCPSLLPFSLFGNFSPARASSRLSFSPPPPAPPPPPSLPPRPPRPPRIFLPAPAPDRPTTSPPATLARAFLGFFLGAVPALILGVWMGSSRSVRRFTDPFISATHPLPKIALLPLIMLILGI